MRRYCARFTSRIHISSNLDPHNFFWIGSFAPYFRKSLRYHNFIIYQYQYISFSESLVLFCALSKKLKIFVFFF